MYVKAAAWRTSKLKTVCPQCRECCAGGASTKEIHSGSNAEDRGSYGALAAEVVDLSLTVGHEVKKVAGGVAVAAAATDVAAQVVEGAAHGADAAESTAQVLGGAAELFAA